MYATVNSKDVGENAYSQISDADLVALIQDGNHDAFSALLRRHSTMALRLAQRTLNSLADAEDVTQTVFIRLWQKPFSWQADRSAFGTWLYRVVLNACYDLQRKTTRRSELDIEQAAEPKVSDVLDELARGSEIMQRQRRLQAAIATLPSSQRDAINLAVHLALPQADVAAILGVSVKAVESLLVRAKRTIKQAVNEQANDK